MLRETYTHLIHYDGKEMSYIHRNIWKYFAGNASWRPWVRFRGGDYRML